MKLYTTLEQQLKKEPNFVTDNGELKKWVVLNKAQNFDEELIGLLLDNADLKEKFFVNVKGTLVFNQNLFVQFLEQKNYLNDSYTQYKNKVGLTIDGKYLKQRNEVALVWPFKDCILEGGQSREEDKREEIFFNEILAQDEITQLLEPKVLTNAKRIDKDGEKPLDQFNRNENGTITDNLIIKGNNLLALHTLKEEFAGKVKLIYIDPPYNTGNDSFKYNDTFNHSTWLTFMKNRLEVAKVLLSKDGFILIHIDDVEGAYLKVLLDDVFGKENFVNVIAVRDSHPSGLKLAHKEKTIIKTKSLIYAFRKSNDSRLNPHYQVRDKWDTHFNTYVDIDKKPYLKLSLSEVVKNELPKLKDFKLNEDSLKNEVFKKWAFENRNKIFQSTKEIPKDAKQKSIDNKDQVISYENSGGSTEFAFNGRRLSPLDKSIGNIGFDGYFQEDFSKLLCDFWDDVDFNNSQNEGDVSFPSGKKPEFLLARIISMFTNKNDIVLDFFVGSGSTTAVSHKLQRQYIGIEQLDYIEDLPTIRLQKVIQGEQGGISKYLNWQGGGSFVYLELKKYNQNFIEQIEEAKDTVALLQIWEQMKAKSFLSYNVDIKKQDEHLEEFKTLSLAEQKQHLFELLDKNQLYVNLSSLNDADFACTEEEKKVTKEFYQIKK
jgi:adenine-specific DNA-methyltransferase